MKLLCRNISLPLGIVFQIYQAASYLCLFFFSRSRKDLHFHLFSLSFDLGAKTRRDFGQLSTGAHTSQDKEMDVHEGNGHEDQEAIERERQEWARQMRLRFTPPEMLHEDGSIDFEYAPCMLSFIPDCRLVG
jgi:hypothetical protein